MFLLIACGQPSSKTDEKESNEYNINYLQDVKTLDQAGQPQAVIEVPAGTVEKWEVNKSTGRLEWTKINEVPRVVDYLGYPGNYGMIPKTLNETKTGGDGDPLDVLVLGGSIKRGEVVPIKILGVLRLIDEGESDEKLVAVHVDSKLARFSEISDLQKQYPGMIEILEIWFSNYKGEGQIISDGFAGQDVARDILERAIKAYQEK